MRSRDRSEGTGAPLLAVGLVLQCHPVPGLGRGREGEEEGQLVAQAEAEKSK